MTPLKYLKDQLRFTLKEWQALPNEDKATLKEWAAEEMAALGIE